MTRPASPAPPLLLPPHRPFHPAGTLVNLQGGAESTSRRTNIFRQDWSFEKMGIGGLDTEFSDIFRRAFASRLFPAR